MLFADTYPIAAQFEKTATDLKEQQASNTELAKLADTMVSTLAEYEHGTANPEDVFVDIMYFDLSDMDDESQRRELCLKLLSAAYTDLLLVVANQ